MRTITGKGYRVRVIDIGPWKYVTFAAVCLYFAASLSPFVVLIVVSIIPYFDYETFMTFPSHWAEHYRTVLRHASFLNGLRNSVLLSVVIALVTVFAGIVMAFTIHRTRAVGTKIFEFIGTLPLAFPPLVLSVGLVIIFIGTPLYNSLLSARIGLIRRLLSLRVSQCFGSHRQYS